MTQLRRASAIAVLSCSSRLRRPTRSVRRVIPLGPKPNCRSRQFGVSCQRSELSCRSDVQSRGKGAQSER